MINNSTQLRTFLLQAKQLKQQRENQSTNAQTDENNTANTTSTASSSDSSVNDEASRAALDYQALVNSTIISTNKNAQPDTVYELKSGTNTIKVNGKEIKVSASFSSPATITLTVDKDGKITINNNGGNSLRFDTDEDLNINVAKCEYSTFSLTGGRGKNNITVAEGVVMGSITTYGGNDTIVNNGDVNTINGGAGNDSITNNGTVRDDIRGEDGNDTIVNNGTVNDDMRGGEGNDTITNKGYASLIYGEAGNDTITNEGTVNRYVYGGIGEDTLNNRGDIMGSVSDIETQNIQAGTVNGIVYKNGDKLSGMHTDGKMYQEGKVLTGVSTVDNKYYKNGELLTGGGDYSTQYLYYTEGVLRHGIDSTDNKMYENGKVLTGISTIDGKAYNAGALCNGEIRLSDGNYHCFKDGEPVTGMYNSYMYEDGVRLTGQSSVDGKCYSGGYLNGSGRFNSGYLHVETSSSSPKFTGVYNEITYQEGLAVNGVYTDGLMYKAGKLFSGEKDGKTYSEGKLMVNGQAANTTVDGILYKAGAAFNGIENNVGYINGEKANGILDGKHYVNGKPAAGTVGPHVFDSNGNFVKSEYEFDDESAHSQKIQVNGKDISISLNVPTDASIKIVVDKNGVINIYNNGARSLTFGATTEDLNINVAECEYSTFSVTCEGKGKNNITVAEGVTMGDIYAKGGIDNIVNNGSVSTIDAGTGNDTITNNGTVRNNIGGGDGNDTIINNGTVSYSMYGGEGNDTMVNRGSVGYAYGEAGDDTITNNGTVRNNIGSGVGNDTIINNGTVGSMYGGDGNDTMVNRGSVVGYASGEAGDDTITNEGTVNGSVYGGIGEDTLNNRGDIMGSVSDIETQNIQAGTVNGIVYKNGDKLSGMHTDGKMYQEGKVLTGVSTIDGKAYNAGALCNGEIRLSDGNYHCFKNGEPVTGMYGSYIYMYEDGVRLTGFSSVDGKYYDGGYCRGSATVSGKSVRDGIVYSTYEYSGSSKNKKFNGTINGHLIVDGKAKNGVHTDGLMYKAGLKFTGIDKNGYEYKNGKLIFTITDDNKIMSNGKLYSGPCVAKSRTSYKFKNGVLVQSNGKSLTSNVSVNGIMYLKGSGKAAHQTVINSVYYEHGVPASGVKGGVYYGENGKQDTTFTGVATFDGKLYIKGELAKKTVYKGKLYINGLVSTGYVSYNGKLYKGGELFTGVYKGYNYSKGVKGKKVKN